MEKNNTHKEFFLLNNKSGSKTRRDYLEKNYKNILQEIELFTQTNENLFNKTFKEQIWHFINNQKETPKCKNCDKHLKFKKSLSEGYGKYCSIKCTNQDENHILLVKNSRDEEKIQEKVRVTTTERYGVTNYFKRTDLIKNDVIEKHGVEHVSHINGVRDKIETTCKERYGYKTILGSPHILKKSHSERQRVFNEKYNHLNILNIDHEKISINCHQCDKDYVINRSLLHYRDKHKIETCIYCNPMESGGSYHEKEIVKFLNENNITTIENCRLTIPPKEIDIVIPHNKVGIEFNGIYWHNELFVSNDYHLNKTKQGIENGYEIIHIFQDEWLYKRNIVESILRNKLNITTERVYGRKCIIKEIPSKECRMFLDDNHIQGYVKSSIKIGLFYDEELVSVMTFGKNRKSLGQTHIECHYEMLRFSNKINTNVIGGASKLFKYFIRNYNPKKITSYSDKRYFNGGLYEKLGFNFIHNTKPSYWYVRNQKREHRFKYRKDVLVKEGFDKTKTEHEIMVDRGIYRIYDSGNKKWIWET